MRKFMGLAAVLVLACASAASAQCADGRCALPARSVVPGAVVIGCAGCQACAMAGCGGAYYGYCQGKCGVPGCVCSPFAHATVTHTVTYSYTAHTSAHHGFHPLRTAGRIATWPVRAARGVLHCP
jgi:hypothetical protein